MDIATLREDMVDSLEHESKAVIQSPDVSVAMRTVPREEFTPDDRLAYQDRAIDHEGTRILSPSTVGLLLEALSVDRGNSVLIVGAGVGYTAAVLAEILGDAQVHAVEITRRFVYQARSNLEHAGYGGVFVDCRDGATGMADYAPYDRILIEAAAIEPPQTLRHQLTQDGRLVMPKGYGTQKLVAYEQDEIVDTFGSVAFRPLLIKGEQAGAVERNRTSREDREHAIRASQRRKGWEQTWIDWSDKL